MKNQINFCIIQSQTPLFFSIKINLENSVNFNGFIKY